MAQSIAQLFGPSDLPSTLAALSRDIAAVRAATEGLLRETLSQPDVADTTVRSVSISSATPAVWQTPEQIILIGAVLSADTAGRYGLTIENDTSRWWRIAANAPFDLGFQESRPLVIPRGLRLTITPPGSPNWDLILWWVSGTSQGRAS